MSALGASSLFALAKHYHTRVSAILLLPLLATVCTGALYRVLRAVFNVEKQYIKWLLGLHTLSIAGLGAVYPLLLAALVFALLFTALPLLARHAWSTITRIVSGRRGISYPWNATSTHRAAGYIALLPLLLFAGSGALYTIERYWGAGDTAYMKRMMQWHQMSFVVPSVVWIVVGAAVAFAVALSGAFLLTRIYSSGVEGAKFIISFRRANEPPMSRSAGSAGADASSGHSRYAPVSHATADSPAQDDADDFESDAA